MQAARWYGPGNIALEERPIPELGDDEALVDVAYVGLCGSDLEEWREGPVVARPPVILGHEISGRVSAAARDGSGPPVGTPVVVDVVTGCGSCFHCLHHEEGRCQQLVVTGQHVDGGLATHVRASAHRLVPVPAGVTLRDAALAEPLAVAVRAFRRAAMTPGSNVIIVGGGPVGILAARVAGAMGAAKVIVVEPRRDRHRHIIASGAVPLWDEDSTQLQRRAIGDMAVRGGADLVVESAGRPNTPALAASLARPGGTIVLLGVTAHADPIDILDVVLAEKRIIGSAAHMWDDDVQVAVDFLANGHVRVSDLITHETDLADIGAGLDTLAGGGVVKMLVRIAGE
ncbi:alcohol dehydrogenase catalytic domain-containing protein (plasmid) [Herbiconiux sp. KACC 21604]|uniref:zinc-dependent alcohol dehydrogenase n=1 Tax=unclassified Herbiconiux TaxID=2618217 RepID=UPI0014930064|nr:MULTISPECIES: alcohol dehydrogenase catalytic domain-containing protein [unclassified Herbiconiux]QJU56317.1 alcohol dehydrogenase catalytic domain-containing protein [Herbiconiux sp. SALV-R1]WPO88824.1 alcohol dehydrogenase catalytic domain-containing protein [Herbiconiux sp. KACC 21604]